MGTPVPLREGRWTRSISPTRPCKFSGVQYRAQKDLFFLQLRNLKLALKRQFRRLLFKIVLRVQGASPWRRSSAERLAPLRRVRGPITAIGTAAGAAIVAARRRAAVVIFFLIGLM